MTDAQKASAKVLLDAGNSLFVQHDYVAALDKYRQAIAAWDHPAIRFNIVRCLIQLDRTLEASDNLQVALAYGAAPLEDSVYSEALAYGKLLANQIGHVEVHCTQPGVDVSLDGQHVVGCPARPTRACARRAPDRSARATASSRKAVSVVVIGGKHEDGRARAPIAARRAQRRGRASRWDRLEAVGVRRRRRGRRRRSAR